MVAWNWKFCLILAYLINILNVDWSIKNIKLNCTVLVQHTHLHNPNITLINNYHLEIHYIYYIISIATSPKFTSTQDTFKLQNVFYIKIKVE